LNFIDFVVTNVVTKIPDFEWDYAKNNINLRKHGISFEEAKLIFEGQVVSKIDNRFEFGEVRTISIGAIEDVIVVAVVHTDRDRNIRIISARSANKRERSLYHVHIRKAAQGARVPNR